VERDQPACNAGGFHQKEDSSLEVEVDQLVKDLDGNVIFNGKVKHIYIINDGFLQQMNIELN
jgi:hypothetical protein